MTFHVYTHAQHPRTHSCELKSLKVEISSLNVEISSLKVVISSLKVEILTFYLFLVALIRFRKNRCYTQKSYYLAEPSVVLHIYSIF